MPVIPLTITVSLCLVFTFVIFFLREYSRRFSNAERESLLPLGDETPRLVVDDDSADDACGGRSAERSPCTGSQKNSPSTASR
jgi:hypothetical protein